MKNIQVAQPVCIGALDHHPPRGFQDTKELLNGLVRVGDMLQRFGTEEKIDGFVL